MLKCQCSYNNISRLHSVCSCTYEVVQPVRTKYVYLGMICLQYIVCYVNIVGCSTDKCI